MERFKVKVDLNTNSFYLDFKKLLTWVVLARSITVLLGIVTSIIIGRYYGPTVLGILAIVVSIHSIATQFATLGFDTAILRFIPEYKTKYSFKSLYELYRKVLVSISLTSILISAIIYILFDFIATAIEISTQYTSIVQFSLIFIFFNSLYNYNLKVSRTFDNKTSFIALILAQSGFKLLFLVLLGGVYFSAYTPLYSFLIAVFVSSLLSLYLVQSGIKKIKTTHYKKANYSILYFLKISLPMMSVGLVALFTTQANLFILLFYHNEGVVGFYSVSVLISSILTFVISSVNTVLATKISELYHSNQIDKMFSIAVSSSKLITLISFFIFVLLYLFGNDFLVILYGDEFDVSFLPMMILSIGNLVNAATGSTGILLNMTGHQKPVLFLSSIISIISLLLSYIMIPKFGAVGSASSVAFSTILLNLLFLIFIYRRFGRLSCYIPFVKSRSKYEKINT